MKISKPGIWLCAILLCGCAAPGEEPEEVPFMRGPIADIQHHATGSGILVEAGPGSMDACGIQATADASTVFQRRTADRRLVEATLSELSVGDTVEVYVRGPIAESCPTQGHADRIVLVR